MMEPQRGFNLRQFWHAFLERIWIVALCLLAGFFVALGYLNRTPKSYQAHAVLEHKTEHQANHDHRKHRR